jgi:hypothetical protein
MNFRAAFRALSFFKKAMKEGKVNSKPVPAADKASPLEVKPEQPGNPSNSNADPKSNTSPGKGQPHKPKYDKQFSFIHGRIRFQPL